MTDATHCPACGHVNALAAETCENCGEPLRPADTPLHPGETFRDPDDLTPEPPPRKPNQRSALPPGAWMRAEGRAAAIAEEQADAESEAAALRVLAARMAHRRELSAAGEHAAPATRPAHYAGF